MSNIKQKSYYILFEDRTQHFLFIYYLCICRKSDMNLFYFLNSFLTFDFMLTLGKRLTTNLYFRDPLTPKTALR